MIALSYCTTHHNAEWVLTDSIDHGKGRVCFCSRGRQRTCWRISRITRLDRRRGQSEFVFCTDVATTLTISWCRETGLTSVHCSVVQQYSTDTKYWTCDASCMHVDLLLVSMIVSAITRKRKIRYRNAANMSFVNPSSPNTRTANCACTLPVVSLDTVDNFRSLAHALFMLSSRTCQIVELFQNLKN